MNRSRAGLAVALLGLGSLAAFGALALFGDSLGEPTSAGSNGFSRSALGHRALRDLLDALELPVTVQRTKDEVGQPDDLLVLAEPQLAILGPLGLRRLVYRHREVLLVLPKRTGRPDPEKPGWLVDSADREEAAEPILEALGIEALVETSGPFAPTVNPLAASPTLDKPQTLRTDDLQPVVADHDHLLVGELRREQTHLVVLSDPDPIATFDLGQGDNALFAVQLIERQRKANGRIVFDEVTHGFAFVPSLTHELTSFPLVLALTQALLAALLFVWAGLVRFAPTPGQDPDGEGFGKALLLANTAELLRFGNQTAEALRAYRELTYDELRAALHLPGGLVARDQALQRLSPTLADGTVLDFDTLNREIDALYRTPAPDTRAVLLAVQRLRKFQQEVSRGAR